MRFQTRLITSLLVLALLCSAFPRSAHAYLDPGSGSFIIQIMLAALFAGLLALRLFWSRVKAFFQKLFSKGEKDEQDES